MVRPKVLVLPHALVFIFFYRLMLADTFTLGPDGVQLYKCVPVDILFTCSLLAAN